MVIGSKRKNREDFYRELAMSVMKKASWAKRCSASTLKSFQEKGEIRCLKRKEVLLKHRTSMRHIGMVISGVIEFSRVSPHAKRHVLDYLDAGKLFNYVAYFDEGYTIHDGIAHTDATVLLLDSGTIEHALTADKEFTRAIIKELCLRARQSIATLTYASLFTIRQRCAWLLLHFMDCFGTPHPEGTIISMKLSQEHLSEMIGCTRPILNRELKLLEQEGKISISYSSILILDKSGLENLIIET